ncbi:MAG TPA: glycosyl hydrolase [Acidimicrobiales bacterium]|nr:glycosyl hydrolase [Acidimicrobiales bacterium]
MKPTRLCAVLVAALALGASLAAGATNPEARRTSPASSPRSLESRRFGVYRGAGNSSGVRRFETWTGRSVDQVLDFFDGRSWRTIENPSWILDRWQADQGRVAFEWGVPILTTNGSSLDAGAAGRYDRHFSALAHVLVTRGHAADTIRLGWEFNGSWFPWAAAGHEEAFVRYWRRIVNAMRSVPGAHFRFAWNPTRGRQATSPDLSYPGDEYVDYIGLDNYDSSFWHTNNFTARWDDMVNEPFGLDWHRRFAASHRKPMSFDEWGLWPRRRGGGGDDPQFIEAMSRWISSNQVAYANFWDYGTHQLSNGSSPRASAVFRRLFGSPRIAPEDAAPSAHGR